jgi:SWI/SNF-related matrix-associated actin-dependent regulator 1 of chromatin subfamily A
MVVVDEIHKCKNSQSQQGKGLMAFDSSADRIGMTGTLLVNNPYDLYCPMLFTGLINYNKWFFENKFVIKDDWNRPIGYQNMEELHEILYKSSIRRTKDLLDLPEKIYKQEWLEFDSNEEQNVFNAVIGNGNIGLLDKIEPPLDMLAVITRMRQSAVAGELLSSKVKTSTKFNRLNDILEEAKLNGQKVLVFCPFTEALKLGMNYCAEYHPKLIIGGMGAKVQDVIDEHENTDGFSCIFAQEATLGAGFTLVNTEIVVFLSPPWNRSNYDQCVDRIHRIGQKHTVQVIDLLMQDTFDEITYKRLHGKGAMSKALIDGVDVEELQSFFKDMGISFKKEHIPQINSLF